MSDQVSTAAALPPQIDWRHPVRLLALSLRILFLRIVTFGVYHFWGKTEVRRRIWSAVHLDGQPVEYTGTGRELFLGFLMVFFVVLLPLFLLLQGLPFLLFAFPDPRIGGAVVGFLYLAFLVLMWVLFGVAKYRARRYRLSRSRWRGIRGAMAGSPWKFGWTYFWTLLVLPFTLFWAMPWRNVKLQRLLVNDSRLGDMPLRFEGSSRSLYGPFALAWFGAVLIFPAAFLAFAALYQTELMMIQLELPVEEAVKGRMALTFIGIMLLAGLLMLLASVWYKSREINYIAGATHFDAARFRLASTPLGLVWLTLGNFLILMAFVIGAALLVGGLLFLLFNSGMLGMPELAPQLTPELAPQPMQMTEGTEQIPEEMMEEMAGINPFVIVATYLGLLLLGLSATLATPIIAARTARYFVERLAVDGSIDFARVSQSQEAVQKTGEGLAEAFDLDAF